MDPDLKSKVNRLQRSVTNKLNDWRCDQWCLKFEGIGREDQSLRNMSRRVMRILTPSPQLVTPGWLSLSDCEKAENLADSLEALFQPINNLSFPAVIGVVKEAMRILVCSSKLA